MKGLLMLITALFSFNAASQEEVIEFTDTQNAYLQYGMINFKALNYQEHVMLVALATEMLNYHDRYTLFDINETYRFQVVDAFQSQINTFKAQELSIANINDDDKFKIINKYANMLFVTNLVSVYQDAVFDYNMDVTDLRMIFENISSNYITQEDKDEISLHVESLCQENLDEKIQITCDPKGKTAYGDVLIYEVANVKKWFEFKYQVPIEDLHGTFDTGLYVEKYISLAIDRSK
jgi:hypothetical protein